MGEVLNGLQSYFNRALPAMLLYKQERAQYAEAIPDGSKPSLIYGAEHLLRLFGTSLFLSLFIDIRGSWFQVLFYALRRTCSRNSCRQVMQGHLDVEVSNGPAMKIL